jgi:hypothetical protein
LAQESLSEDLEPLPQTEMSIKNEVIDIDNFKVGDVLISLPHKRLEISMEDDVPKPFE